MENEKVSAQIKVHLLRRDFEHYKEQVDEHFESTDEKVESHQEMLINKGKGLMYRVARLENLEETSSGRYVKVTATLAVIIAAISVIMQILTSVAAK